MLKKKIISILTLFLIVWVWYTNAWKVQMVGLDTAWSIYDSNMNLTFLKNWNITTNYLWTTKKVLAFNGNSLRWWTENYVPYIKGVNFQGYYTTYYSCDEITDLWRTPTNNNCTAQTLNPWSSTQYQVIFRNFLQKVYAEDYAYYSYTDQRGSSSNGTFYTYNADVCFSSHEIGKSLCFLYFNCRANQSNCRSNVNRPAWSIGWSVDTSYTFSTIPDGAIQNSPWTLIEGWTINQTAWNQSCPTVQQLINNFGTSYNTGLCYANAYSLSGWSVQNLGTKSIFEIFNSWNEYKDAIDLYTQYERGPYTQEYKQQVFQEARGQSGVRYNAIIHNNYKVQQDITRDGLRTYCHYQLNIPDKNASTCVLSTGASQPVPIKDMITEGAIGQIIWNTYNVATPTTNNNSTTNNNQTVYNQIINNNTTWSWQQASTNSWKTVLNVFDHINSIYAKFTWMFSWRIGKTWIIPEQITRILLVIVLFCLF